MLSPIIKKMLEEQAADPERKEEIYQNSKREMNEAVEILKDKQKRDFEQAMNEPEDPHTSLGPSWGKKAKEDKEDKESKNEIPASAKSAMKHRSACGVKLSDKDLARFWSKIDVKGANECWSWKNSLRGSLGYGQFRIGDRICDAHRIALELGKGPLKKGRYVCHSCDSPKCCNPRHLFAGTQKNNMDDMTEKGRGDN